ncbi:unnamed protein product [Calicophoron daubneyi]|uniref:Major facilitator superfamily (MFS) profile domain-containing protein n=1 Tax=Calicophoron daubneyi TaxID=300641 RepID=A0AAV2TZ22_CALDB
MRKLAPTLIETVSFQCMQVNRMGYADVDNPEEDPKEAAMRKLTGGAHRLRGCFGDRRMILFIVFVALFLDNMLLTIIVPIIPDFLLELSAENKTSMVQDLLSGINESCAVFFREDYYKRPRLSNVWASRGHAPTQGGAMISANRVFDTGTYEIERRSDEFTAFTQYLARQNENLSQYSQAYLTELRGCREMASERLNQMRRSAAGDEHIQIGVMFASKSVVQLLINPMIGPLTNKIGYSIPMFSGFMIMFVSTVVFAFGGSYGVLFFARALQGVGSACSSVSGMGMLATVYPDDKERSRAFSWALSGLAMGVLVGPPFGGILYQFINKEAPFLILATLALLDGILQLLTLRPAVRPEEQRGTSLAKLLQDPYILIAAGSLTFGNMGIAMLEPSLPLWMWERMHAEGWEQGAAFLPCSVSYLIGTNIFGPLAHRIGRGLSAGIGMVIVGVCLIAIPFATMNEHLIVPMFGLGFAIGMVDSSMMPIMGYLVDLRHVAVYGSVYAIADVAFCLGYAVGPIISGGMVQTVGFGWMLWTISIVCLVYSPLTLFLRNPPGRDESKALVDKKQDGGEKNEWEASNNVGTTRQIPTIQLGSTLGYDPTSGGRQTYGYE